MKEILFFSNNENKILEISNFFLKTKINILSLKNYNKIRSPKENGLTFEENAKIKSLYGYKKFKKKCFADDSGICIDALNGLPGVESKTFLNKSKNSSDILKKIIKIVERSKNNRALFETTICLTLNLNQHIFFKGSIKGKISKRISGDKGFGYDPIFIPDGKNITYAQMTIEEKNRISHRYIALTKLKKYILKSL